MQVKEQGWLPQHVLVRVNATNELIACCPLYLKGHSYGEYVFDNSWAMLASRLGQRYYPKLQGCVPFTPATGPRILIRKDCDTPQAMSAVAQTMIHIAGTTLAADLESEDVEEQ